LCHGESQYRRGVTGPGTVPGLGKWAPKITLELYRDQMVFRIGSGKRSHPEPGTDAVERTEPLQSTFEVGRDVDSPVLAEIDRRFVQAFALVGEGIAGATHALLAGDREAAKELVQRDEVVDRLTHDIAALAQNRLLSGAGTVEERRELIAHLRMLTDLERNGDLAEHIARRAARGLGAEMSARSRGLVERMGEVATQLWRLTAEVFAERSADGATVVDDLDDEMDDLHVTLTAEIVAGNMPVPVAIELAMIARFYERFGDHAVSLARRMAALVGGGPDPGTVPSD